MSARTRTILGGLVTVVVLAVVIFALWSASSPKQSTTPPTITLTPSQQQSNAAYQQGLASLESSDTTRAVALFQRAVTLDPNNTAAKSQLAAIAVAKSKSSEQTSTSSTQAKTPPAVDPFSKPVKNLGSLLPKTASGYVLGPAQVQPPDATRSGSPTDTASPITHSLWSVHDRGSSSKAKAFVTQVSKSLYPKDSASVPVNGVTAYFGTDGQHYATVAYVRGRYAFEVVITTSTEPPAQAKTDAVNAAQAFPTKP